MPGNRVVEFFQQQGDALAAPAPVADGIFDRDLLRCGAVPEQNLHRVAYGALVRVVIVNGELPVFRYLHALPERVDTGVGSDVILVILGAQATENQGDGCHVLDAVVAVRRVIQGTGLVDDAHAGLLGFQDHLVDLIEPVLHLCMQGQRRFHRGLGMELSRKGNLEQHVFHDVTAEGAFGDDFIALKQHVLEAPVLRAQRGRVTHLAGQRDQGMAHGAAGSIARRPAFP